MNQVEGKDKILRVAKELIEKKGYSAISSRRIAREAKMSVGTLYHHFPKGKLSILYEIILSYRNEFKENFDISKIEQLNDPEMAKDYLAKLIDRQRQFAPLIKGFEIEFLTNKSVLKDFDDLMKSEKDHFNGSFLMNIFLKANPNIKEPEKFFFIVGKIFTSLIHTHVILENFYGTDEEFVEILYKMIKGFFTTD